MFFEKKSKRKVEKESNWTEELWEDKKKETEKGEKKNSSTELRIVVVNQHSWVTSCCDIRNFFFFIT